MVIIAFVLFFVFVFVGLGKRTLRLDEIIKGFIPFIGSFVVSGLLTYLGWKLLLGFYPQYNDILHGFTYNGHDYIYGFVSLTIANCFLFYKNESKRNSEMSQMVAPLFIWLLINVAIAFQLQGAGFLVLPVLASTLMLGYFVLTQKSNWFLNIILTLPTLLILAPFIQMFPIGLGLKILVGSAILTVLSFTLLLPVFGSFIKKGLWAAFFFFLAFGFFIKAHQSSGYTSEKGKPNSLVYIFNVDTNKANWATYDTNLDEWTKAYLGEKPKSGKVLNTNRLHSKYGSEFTFMADAPMKGIQKPNIVFAKDSTIGNQRYLKIIITPNRKVNRYDIFANEKLKIKNFKANGVQSIDLKSNIITKNSNKIVSYYVVDNFPLTMEFSIPSNQKLDMNLVESSFDLLTNQLFTIAKRRDWMIPTPFVLTDAIIIKQKIKPNEKLADFGVEKQLFPKRKDSINVAIDSIQ
jgi:hypothetical protein